MPRRLLAALLLAALAPSSRAEVKPHGLFSDHMVLQRDVEWNAWGTAAPNEKVAVTLHDERLNKGETVEVSADQEGKFAAKMPARKAGGPFTLTFQGTGAVRCKDVYFGEVWVCSGQSNMEWSVNASAEPDKVKAAAEQPMIRLYTVPRLQANQPADDVKSRWQECTPKTVGNFSAVAYHFGRDLQKALDV